MVGLLEFELRKAARVLVCVGVRVQGFKKQAGQLWAPMWLTTSTRVTQELLAATNASAAFRTSTSVTQKCLQPRPRLQLGQMHGQALDRGSEQTDVWYILWR